MSQSPRLSSFRNWCQNTERDTLVMGILNVTPDSFSDGGEFYSQKQAIRHATQLINNGVDIIDVGGESSRPGADEVSEKEELNRTIPVIQKIRSISSDILISIDTTKSRVALEAIQSGADIINDISSLSFDPKMADIVKDLRVPLVIMHMQGIPSNMQNNPSYRNLIEDISLFFKRKIKFVLNVGIDKLSLIHI